MANRRYLNFDLLLEQEGEGEYRARVVASPLGDTPSVEFRLPFDATGLELPAAQARSGSYGRTRQRRRSAAASRQGLRRPAVRCDLHRRRDVGLDPQPGPGPGRRTTVGSGLRLRLDDAPAHRGPAVGAVCTTPRTERFPAQSERTPLVRFLDVRARLLGRSGWTGRSGCLRSSPRRSGWRSSTSDAEWNAHQTSAGHQDRRGPGRHRPAAGAHARRRSGTWLHNHQTHVIHFVGHGDFDRRPREGFIYFQNARGENGSQSVPRLSGRSCTTTIPCAWWCSTPAVRRAPSASRPVRRDGAGTGAAGRHRRGRHAVPDQRHGAR